MSTTFAADISTNEVFDVANWLDRANSRPSAVEYQPRHRAEVPVDHVAI